MDDCNSCLFHWLSIEIEENPDVGFIQKEICGYCTDRHDFYICRYFYQLGEFFKTGIMVGEKPPIELRMTERGRQELKRKAENCTKLIREESGK